MAGKIFGISKMVARRYLEKSKYYDVTTVV